MEFHKGMGSFRLGEKAGFVFSYILFTSVLYLILTLTGNISKDYAILKVISITFSAIILGFIVKRLLR